MIYAELVQIDRPAVHVERAAQTSVGAWARIQESMGRGVIGGDSNRIEIRIDVFLAELQVLRDIQRLFGETVELGARLREQLQRLIGDKRKREAVVASDPPDASAAENMERELLEAGFVRPLKPFQLRNLWRISQLPHGADFSVPGAGKTTVALANFTLARRRGTVRRALVVAPIAAFDAWKEDAKQCLEPCPTIVVHQGPGSVIPGHAEILLTNYNRLAADYDRLRQFVGTVPTQVILDEAHRIKRGALGVHGRAVLDLAYPASRRDVLTGTPAPQSAHDLIALIGFLYPGQDHEILPAGVYDERSGRDAEVLSEASSAIEKYFVRTTKSELNLPRTQFNVERRPMGSLQQAIYSALIGRYRASFRLDKASRREFDRLGRIMMYLLEAATNPLLLTAGSDRSDEAVFSHPPIELRGDEPLMNLLRSYNEYETPWKYQRVRQIVEAAAKHNEKVLVWSSFVRNLSALNRILAEFNPAMVHGGVPSVEEPAPPELITRERELSRFRNDPKCSVLLANPAACGEGVSLHHWCHHAVFVDRTFNAGQFLQSQDRIHRLGLDKGTLTEFTLLISAGTIDDTVNGRLREKVEALSALMRDPALVRLSLPDQEDATSGDQQPAIDDDLELVFAHVDTAP